MDNELLRSRARAAERRLPLRRCRPPCTTAPRPATSGARATAQMSRRPASSPLGPRTGCYPMASSATKVVDSQIRLSCLGCMSADPIDEVTKSHNASQNHVQVTVVQ